MLIFYKCLLYQYPPRYRREFADEMISVFRDVQADARAASLVQRIVFRARETEGLLAGALHEHLRTITGSDQPISFTRSDMRPEFRFPRSTVFLMLLIFGGVIVAMEKANTIQLKYAAGVGSVWPSLPWFLGFTLLFTSVGAMAVWGILFALRRTGVHRLANIDTAPNRTN
jgi:hypothetical protein